MKLRRVEILRLGCSVEKILRFFRSNSKCKTFISLHCIEGDASNEATQVFMVVKISNTNLLSSIKTNVRKVKSKLVLSEEGPVNHYDCNIAVIKRAGIDLQLIFKVTVHMATCLNSLRILIDCNQLFISNDCKRLIADLVKVTANNQRRLCSSPKSKVTLLLLIA